jgi:putative FmdB family regulatory protein
MAIYAYRCISCGPFEVAYPIGQAPAGEVCAGCAGLARRVFSPPLLARTAPALGRALGAQEASAVEPRVVNEVPPARRRPAPPSDPRHARLPRP